MTALTLARGRTILALVIWVLALTPLLFWALDPGADGTAAGWARFVGTGLRVSMWIALVALVLGVSAYPPFVPSARLWWRRQRTRWTIDKAPMQQAMGRLEHFENSEDHSLIAQVAYQSGELELAIPHALRALELEPDLLKARALLGRILLELRRYPEAAQHLARVVARDEGFGFGDALLRLAKAHYQLGQHDEATRCLERHAQLAGPDRRALLLRGHIADRRGDRAAAREYWSAAAAPAPTDRPLPLEQTLARAKARVSRFLRRPRA